MITRYAEKEDLPEVYAMYIEFLEGKYSKDQIDENACLDVVLQAWARAPCILLEKKSKIIGFAGLNTLVAEGTNVVYLREYCFFVQPKHRSVKAALKLSKAAREVSDTFKIPLLFSHRLGLENISMRSKLLKKLGYKISAIEVSYGQR